MSKFPLSLTHTQQAIDFSGVGGKTELGWNKFGNTSRGEGCADTRRVRKWAGKWRGRGWRKQPCKVASAERAPHTRKAHTHPNNLLFSLFPPSPSHPVPNRRLRPPPNLLLPFSSRCCSKLIVMVANLPSRQIRGFLWSFLLCFTHRILIIC